MRNFKRLAAIVTACSMDRLFNCAGMSMVSRMRRDPSTAAKCVALVDMTGRYSVDDSMYGSAVTASGDWSGGAAISLAIAFRSKFEFCSRIAC